jgi:hypothetical protein
MLFDEMNGPKRLFLRDSFSGYLFIFERKCGAMRADRPQTRASTGGRSEGSGAEAEWEIRRIGRIGLARSR